MFTIRKCLVAQMVKCLPTMRETRVQSLGREDLLEKAMAPHSSTLAWKILWMEEPGRPPSMGSQIVRCNWATSLYILMGRKWYFITVLISFLKWLVMSTSFCVIAVLCNIFSRKTFINIFTHSVSRLFCCFCIPFSSVTQSCLTLCDPMDSSPPGSSVHGILQARMLDWVAIPFSRAASQSRGWTCTSCISCIAGRFFTHWAIKEAD